jgi:hypothetical protein
VDCLISISRDISEASAIFFFRLRAIYSTAVNPTSARKTKLVLIFDRVYDILIIQILLTYRHIGLVYPPLTPSIRIIIPFSYCPNCCPSNPSKSQILVRNHPPHINIRLNPDLEMIQTHPVSKYASSQSREVVSFFRVEECEVSYDRVVSHVALGSPELALAHHT